MRSWFVSKKKAQSLPLNSHGATLIELMVTLGLFSGIAVAMMNLFAGYLKEAVIAENQVALNEAINEFHERIDADLGNATQLISCSCGSPNCVLDPSKPIDCMGKDAGCGQVLLRWESEKALSPFTVNKDGCLGEGRGKTREGIELRGCKARFRLVSIAPQAGSGVPGELRIERDDRPPVSGEKEFLARLPGVYSVSCGRAASDSPGQFRVQLRAKSRETNGPKGSSDFEGFHPEDPGFSKGTHRSVFVDLSFRNQNTPGVYFGRIQRVMNCVRDGESSNGNSASCCSGLVNKNGLCLPLDQCLASGRGSNAEGEDCCSHQLLEGTQKCI